MLNLIISGHDHNGIPNPDPPAQIPNQSAIGLVNLAAQTFKEHNIQLPLEYLEYATAYNDRPYNRILKGYRLVDKAMFQTMPRRYTCDCHEFRPGDDIPCVHLIRAGAPKPRKLQGLSSATKTAT